eukprot:1929625-Rhodomonas_salina.1
MVPRAGDMVPRAGESIKACLASDGFCAKVGPYHPTLSLADVRYRTTHSLGDVRYRRRLCSYRNGFSPFSSALSTAWLAQVAYQPTRLLCDAQYSHQHMMLSTYGLAMRSLGTEMPYGAAVAISDTGLPQSAYALAMRCPVLTSRVWSGQAAYWAYYPPCTNVIYGGALSI